MTVIPVSRPFKISYSFWRSHSSVEQKEITRKTACKKNLASVILKAELFRNSGMKYRKKITYLDILCNFFFFCYESETNTRILSSQVFDYTLRPFSDFSVIGWGQGQA